MFTQSTIFANMDSPLIGFLPQVIGAVPFGLKPVYAKIAYQILKIFLPHCSFIDTVNQSGQSQTYLKLQSDLLR